MNKKDLFAILTILIIYTGFIFTGFSWMLGSKISPLEKRMDHMESEIKVVKTELNNRMDRMETEQKDIKERIIRIESMLGQILIAQNLHHKGKAKPVGKFKKPSTAKPAQRKTASH